MSTATLRIVGAVLLFIIIITTGFFLSNTGKPYNSALLTGHKLISIAAAVFFGITVFQISKAAGLSAMELTGTIVTGILFLSTIISGGLSSINTMPIIFLRIHQISLSLLTISTALTLYTLLHG